MEFEEALSILQAPQEIRNVILWEYQINSKESKQKALSTLKQAEQWMLEQLKINGQDYIRMDKDDQRYIQSSKELEIHSARANEALTTVRKRSLTRKETLDLAIDMEIIGFETAAQLIYDVSEETRQRIMSRANAIGVVKEKIDTIKAYHGIDDEGNLIFW